MDITKLLIVSIFAGLVFSGNLQATMGRRLLTIPGLPGVPGIPATFTTPSMPFPTFPPVTPSTGISSSFPNFPLPAVNPSTPTFTGIFTPPVDGSGTTTSP